MQPGRLVSYVVECEKKNGETKYSKTIHTNKGYRNTYTAQESKILWHDIIIYKF